MDPHEDSAIGGPPSTDDSNRRIAVETVRAEMADAGSVDEVIFACFGADVLKAYRKAGVKALS